MPRINRQIQRCIRCGSLPKKVWDAVSLVSLPCRHVITISLSGAPRRTWESSQAMPVESTPLKRAATLRLPLLLCALCLNYGGDELRDATREGGWLQWITPTSCNSHINALVSKGCQSHTWRSHAQEMDSLLWPIHQPPQHPVEDLVSDESNWFIKLISRTSSRQEMWRAAHGSHFEYFAHFLIINGMPRGIMPYVWIV